MSALLKLRINADWPAHSTQCEWALYDVAGKLLQRGLSEPQHWPQAERCELVLSADQCLVLEAKLPKGARREDAKLLGYAVEDRLIGDIHNEHVVAGESDGTGRTPVWLVSRARLAAVLGALAQLGRAPRRACCELQLAPLAAGCWTACIGSRAGFVSQNREAGFSFDLSDAPPPELLLAVQAARAEGTLPQAIDLYCEQEARGDDPAWQSALGVTVRRAGEYVWHRRPAHPVANLLVGEFAPPRERHSGWAPFKPALTLAATALVLYSLFSVGQWAWMSQRAGALRAEATETFRAAFPQTQNIVEPVAQMRQLYDQRMRERGRLGDSDFLPLLASVSEALGAQASYRSMAYEEGRLQFTVALKDAAAAERLREALGRRGLTLTLRETRPTRAGLETSFSVRFGS